MAQEVVRVIRLVIKAGQAKPAPPVGPALGQHGLNIMKFCKEFNARTSELRDDVPVPVRVYAYKDKSFTFDTKAPPVTYFLKKAAGLETGSTTPGHKIVGEVTMKHVYEIASIKQTDPLQARVPLESICKSIIGTARSMGIRVVEN
eukprot:jgi/Chlat1/9119/Chrsp97S08425